MRVAFNGCNRKKHTHTIKRGSKMELGTKFLFNLLLKYTKPDLVCDVGAMDGSDALRFQKMLPRSKVVLFEANKHNYNSINHNPVFKKQKIQAFNEIVSNVNGTQYFHMVKMSEIGGTDQHLRGMSSTLLRKEDTEAVEHIELKSVRLDTKINRMGTFDNIALWIDVEGATYEVLESLSGVRQQVNLIHAEVETKTVWKGQKLKHEVEQLAADMGYVVIGHGRNEIQHDIILMNRSYLERSSFMINLLVWIAFIRTLRIKRIPKYVKQFINTI